MITVQFTSNIQRYVSCPVQTVSGNGTLRKHMVIFINGERIQDRVHLSDPISDGSEIYVFQALSGG